MDEILEKYKVFINEPSCVKIEHGNKVALFDGPVCLLLNGRKVMYERKFESPKAAKKMFIKKVKELF